jgi:cobalt-zinc-cadmium efflux system outer membrane protein
MVAIFFLTASTGKAEEIALEEALRLFYKNNYDILINRYEIDKAYGDYVGAKLRPNPVLTANAIGLRYENNPRLSDDSQLTVRIDQIIELGRKRELRTNSAFSTLEASKLSHKDLLRTLLVGFYTAYYNLQLDKLNIEFGLYDLGRFKRIQEVAGRRFDAGFLSLMDYTKIKLSAIDIENNLTNFEKQFRADIESFNFLIASRTQLEPQKLAMKETFPQYAEESLVDVALKNRYDLLALRKQSEAARFGISLAKASRIPDVTVGAEYDSFGKDSRPRFGVGVSLPLPLFNRNQDEILKKNAEFNQLEEQIKKTERQIVSDIRQALNNYQGSLKIYDAYRTRKKEMEDLLKKSEEAFSLGGITGLDLLDTQKTIRDFVTKYNQALVQALLNEELLKVYTGELR